MPKPSPREATCGTSGCFFPPSPPLNVPMENPITKGNPTFRYRTTFAKNLCGVLQDTPELQEFDELRYLLKNTTSMENDFIQKYKKLSAIIDNRVFQQYKKSSQKHVRNVCKKLLVHEWKYKL